METRALVALLDSRLLWMGSAPPIDRNWFAEVAEGVRFVANPKSWIDLGGALVRRSLDVPLAAVLLVVLVAALTVARRRNRRQLVELAASVGKYATDSFLVTLRALGATLLLALGVPLALAGVGALLVTGRPDAFAEAVGVGLFGAASVWLLLDFFLQMCRRDGLAHAHFKWNERARHTLFVNLRWLVPVEVAAGLVVATCDATENEVYQQGLGRLFFLVGSLGLTLFGARAFRPESGVFSELMSRDGWAWRLRRLWYGALVLVPAGLGVAAAAGYYFTASEIQSRIFFTGLVVIAGSVTYSILKRWLLVERRRLAVKQARERLTKQREARQKSGASDDLTSAASGDAVPDLDLQTIDVSAASAQTLSLVRTLVTGGVLAGLWAVWSNLLPALSVLERVELSDPALDATGAVLVAPVTVWSLLVAAFAAVITFVAARNLPAVLELAVLQRFPLDHGMRYAAATLTRYFVLAVGVVVVSNLVGIDWSRAQWIIAALGVGLGFGLQEIVANFVSGLIILFERPIRVGDTVTVGTDSGTVSRLRIRATTITDWDNKEILVPNKNFITDRVVNWTLSNPVTRLMLRIGVAYGTDAVRAQKVLADAVKSVPAVLEEPPFSVLFVAFGDSSLDFEVRVFVADLSKRLPTLHELHTAIQAALRDAGIEVPFPQRDVHLIGRASGSAEVPADPEA